MRKLDYPYLLCRSHPGLVAFLVMIYGFIILALSYFWREGQVSIELEAKGGGTFVKEVGYGLALNWSLALTLLLPAAILYVCKVYRLFPLILRNLAMSRMAVTAQLEPVSPQQLLDLWEARIRKYQGWLAVLIGAAFFFSLWEWYSNSALPLWANDSRLAPEADWSIGVLFDPAGKPVQAIASHRAAAAALSFLAFLGQGLIVACLLTFIYKALIIGVFVSDLSRPEGDLRLIPNLRSHDPRLGFELFGELIEMSLVCIGIFYGIFYLSRMQNVYLRSSEPGIVSFMVNRLLIGLGDKPFDFGAATEAFRSGMRPDSESFDYSSIMVSLGAFAVLMVAAFVISSTVRDAAVRSRNELQSALQNDPIKVKALTSDGVDQVEKNLDGMVFWPVRYIRAREFFGLIVLGVTCIAFYKMGLILVGLLLFRVFWDVARYIFGSAKP